MTAPLTVTFERDASLHWGGVRMLASQVNTLCKVDAARVSAAAPEAPKAPEAGLVHSSTTHTRGNSEALNATAVRVLRQQASGFRFERDVVRLKRMHHGVLTAARLQGECARRGGMRWRAAMITMTYAPEHRWSPSHVRNFLTTVRNHMRRRRQLFQYVWVAEMQQRGAVHYHVCVWMPEGVRLPKPDQVGWWPWGATKIEWAKKAAGYIAKYASKGSEPGAPPFPRGIRISGQGGLDREARREFRWWRAPKEAREALGPDADIRRVTGGRVDAVTGSFWRSLWRFVRINGAPFIVPMEEQLCVA